MKEFIVKLIKNAGNFLLKNFRKDYSLLRLRKLSKEIVTKYDKISNKMIIKALSKKFPEYNILTEESGFVDKNSDFTWVVDPLDGSSNFASANPFFAVSIALLHFEEPIFGVVYGPFLNELFFAEEGRGTFLNKTQVFVSEVKKLKESYVVCCEGKSTNLRISKINAKLHPKVKDLRKLGSGSLECAWVSCGRAEAFVITEAAPWDVAAGVLLVREAGGKVTDFKGRKWKPIKTDALFSNNKIHDKILKIIGS